MIITNLIVFGLTQFRVSIKVAKNTNISEIACIPITKDVLGLPVKVWAGANAVRIFSRLIMRILHGAISINPGKTAKLENSGDVPHGINMRFSG